jgi:predicted RNA binding protein YcfA (HicA-like mRNA interferase family)
MLRKRCSTERWIGRCGVKVRDVIATLAQNGWAYQDTTGDHRNYKKRGERYIITVPGKLGDEVSPGVLAPIRRKTGLPFR